MSARLGTHSESGDAEMAEGLAAAHTVKTVAAGRDEDGDRLLLIETSDSGAFSFRLTEEAREMLADALQDEKA